jgi:hypothetical protein
MILAALSARIDVRAATQFFCHLGVEITARRISGSPAKVGARNNGSISVVDEFSYAIRPENSPAGAPNGLQPGATYALSVPDPHATEMNVTEDHTPRV